MQALPDKDLILKAQQGDDRAFRDLVDRHQRFVFNVAYRFTGNVVEAEDIAQYVFVKLWKNMGQYRGEIKLTTWLYAIITNQSLDFLKSAERKRGLMSLAIDEKVQIHDEASGEESADNREMLEIITRLARRLPDKQQAVFVLRDLQGLPAAEVCQILNLSADTLKSNLCHARMRIREMVTKHYKEITAL